MMTATKRRRGVVGVICALAFLGSAPRAIANEVWVAPTYQQDIGGLGVSSNVMWPVTPVGAVRLAWSIPDDLNGFQSAKVAIIPGGPGGAATLNLFICSGQNGSAISPGACASSGPIGFTGIANQLVEIDISAALTGRVGTAGTSYLAILAYTTPTTGTDHIVGLRFTYAPKAPAGVAGLAANTFTGTQTAPAFVGDGSALTNLPPPAPGSASYIQNTSVQQSGANFNIAGNGRVGGNLTVAGSMSGSGSNLTALTAANITVGKIAGTQIGLPLQLSADLLGQGVISGINLNSAGAGVYGQSNLTNAGGEYSVGVYGRNIGTGYGVYGTTNASDDVRAGVRGDAPNGNGVVGSGGRAGVRGESTAGNGVYGTSGSPDFAGVTGYTGLATGKAIWGFAPTSTAFAGYFTGTVHVSGSTGIGTTAPQAKLHVVTSADGLRIQGSATGTQNQAYTTFVDSAGTLVGYVGDAGFVDSDMFLASEAGDVVLETNWGRVLTATAGGRVGVGTPTPAAARLQSEGNTIDAMYAHSVNGIALHARSEQNHAAYFEGTTWFTRTLRLDELGGANTSLQLCRNTSNQISSCSSSLRYKTNVRPFLGGLDVVGRLRPIRFDWRNGGAADLGLAAEEVAQVEPLLTFRNERDEVEGVKYNQLSVVLINAVKEQQAEIESQRSQIRRSDEQLELQQRRIEALERTLAEFLASSRP